VYCSTCCELCRSRNDITINRSNICLTETEKISFMKHDFENFSRYSCYSDCIVYDLNISGLDGIKYSLHL
jgi:hypothetical protein